MWNVQKHNDKCKTKETHNDRWNVKTNIYWQMKEEMYGNAQTGEMLNQAYIDWWNVNETYMYRRLVRKHIDR